MKRSLGRYNAKIVFWVLLFGSYSVFAAGVVIDALGQGYADLPQVAVTTVDAPRATRIASATQIAAAYRADSGAPFATLPPGSTFKVVWPDGSSEYVVVVDPASSRGVRPIRGSKRAAPATAEAPAEAVPALVPDEAQAPTPAAGANGEGEQAQAPAMPLRGP